MTKIAFQHQTNPIANIIVIRFAVVVVVTVAVAGASFADAVLIMFFLETKTNTQDTDKARENESSTCETQHLSIMQRATVFCSIFTHRGHAHSQDVHDDWLV